MPKYPVTTMSARLGLIPTDTIGLKERMQKSSDAVRNEMTNGMRGIRAARKRNPNDPTLPPDVGTPDPLELFRAQSDTLKAERAGKSLDGSL